MEKRRRWREDNGGEWGGVGAVMNRRRTRRSEKRGAAMTIALLPVVLVSGSLLTLWGVVTIYRAASSCGFSSLGLDQAPTQVKTGAKIPQQLSSALLHFATSSEVSQQSKNEISVSMNVLLDRGGCNFLVFGMWHDSLLWATFNYGGRTAFLDESQEWIDRMKERHPQLEAYKIDYGTTLGAAADLLATSKTKIHSDCRPNQPLVKSSCPLALSKQLPKELLEVEWDVIMIDGPRSYLSPSFPGRMTAIFTAAVLARTRGSPGYVDIFVHDVSRPVEHEYSLEFLCRSNLVNSVGDLWHFQVHPSNALDFCLEGNDSIPITR